MRGARIAIVVCALLVVAGLVVAIVRLTTGSEKVVSQRPDAPTQSRPPVIGSVEGSPPGDEQSPRQSPRGGLANVDPTATPSPPPAQTPSDATDEITKNPTTGPTEPAAAVSVRTPAGAPQGAAQRASEQLTRAQGLIAQANPGAPVASAPLGANLLTVPGRQIGSWESTRLENGMSLATNNDRALRAGRVVSSEEYSTATSQARVRLPSGQRYTAPVASARDTFQAMRAVGGPACADCQDIALTSVKATTMILDASAGKVTLPAWEFSVRGSRAKLVRPAVTDAGLVRFTPAYRGAVPAELDRDQLPLWRTSISDDKRVISAGIERRDVSARGGCWRLFASETDSAVAIYAAQGPADVAGACATPAGNVFVRLAAPLGDRVIIDTYWERALPLR